MTAPTKTSTHSQHLSGRITRLKLRPSRLARKLLLSLYLIAILSVLLIDATITAQLVLLAIVCAWIAWCEYRSRRARSAQEVYGLSISAHAVHSVLDSEGFSKTVVRYDYPYINAHYLVLRLKLQNGKQHCLHLFFDSTDRESFRRLRILGLRQRQIQSV